MTIGRAFGPLGLPMTSTKSTRMKLHMPRLFLLLFLLAFFATNQLRAQAPVGIRISALTSAERDALVQSTHAAGEMNVVYACVPAGIIVFATNTGSGSRETLRTKAMAALAPVISAARIQPADITQQAAETACENARGQ